MWGRVGGRVYVICGIEAREGNLFGTKINTGKLQPTSVFRRNMDHSCFVTFAVTAPYFLNSAIVI